MKPETPVLVAVLNNHADWQRIQHERWYRIPLKHAPRHMTAQIIAWYQTKAFEHGNCIRWYAPIDACRIVTRRELLPDQADHARADERYWQIMLGELAQLPRPIPATTFKRVTFIPTRWERLLHAQSVNDLWLADSIFAQMVQQLEAEGYSVANRRLRESTEPQQTQQIELQTTLNGIRIEHDHARLSLDWSDLIWQPNECMALIRAFVRRSQ